ncbi:TonB-dependent receptor [Halioglobus maricola]|uniref:TonB-dependent receptor n=1 Tax=Halioglobus maricola TaxID=2601894 RepID=A0A5P9NPI0_9GAMM|nr:TonB-dependent receptor [Halioglobus maricola]QFU76808.1 TonB-dependent receptor [Halioglobus maricola]
MNSITSSIRKFSSNQRTFLHSSVGVLALSGALGSVQAVAQGEQALEEVVVTGIRSSLMESLDTKRYADSVVDAITAEDLGKFPDKNVADSLARITGVSVTRGFGEGEKIAVRGTSPDQNRTLLNGAAVGSADWFVLDNPSRAFNYTLLPSTIVSALEVYKSPQADIQEGSLGGTVMLRTRRPLDMDANSGVIQVQGMYSETSEEWDPNVSALYSWKNDAETLGFNISLTKQDRTMLREGQEVLGYQFQDFGMSPLWTPRAIGDAHFLQERERETALFTGQWRPTDAGELTLTYLNSELEADNTNYNRYEWFNGQAGGGTIDPTTATRVGSGVVAGSVENNYAEYYVIDRVSYSETESLDLQYSHTFDSVTMDLRVGHTEAEGGTERDRHYGFDRFLDGSDFNGLSHTPYWEGSVEDDAALETRGLGWMMEGSRIMQDEEDYASADFEIPLEWGVVNAIKVGAMYRDHDKSQDQDGTRFHFLSDAMHSDDATEYSGGSDTSGWDRWLWGNLNAGTLGDYTRGRDGAPFPLMDLGRANSVIYPTEAYENATVFQFLPDTWDVNEEIMAAYFKADFEADAIRGNFGVRVVQTDVASTGYNWEGDWVAASLDMVGGYDLLVDLFDPRDDFNVRQETVDHDYTEVLPNLNLSMDMSEDSVLRFSAAKVMARPDYIKIANQEGYNIDTASGTRGNPELDPETANQFDVAYEWYFADAALLAVTYFNKDISDSIINSTSVEKRTNDRTGQQVDVLFVQPENGKGAEVQGLEFSYQQNFGNFGVIANYTYTDADSKDDRDAVNNPGSGLVVGASEHMTNLTGFYENDWLSARLSYNWRSEWYDGLSEFGSEMYVDDYGQLDTSVVFGVGESWDIVLEGINITGEEQEQYHIDDGRPARLYDNGARYVIGFNYHF